MNIKRTKNNCIKYCTPVFAYMTWILWTTLAIEIYRNTSQSEYCLYGPSTDQNCIVWHPIVFVQDTYKDPAGCKVLRTTNGSPLKQTPTSGQFQVVGFPSFLALATEHKCSFLITVPVSYHGGFMDTVSGTISSPHNSLLIAATNIQQCERFPSPLSMRDSTLSDVDRVFVKVLRRYISPPKETVITLWACSFSRHKASWSQKLADRTEREDGTGDVIHAPFSVSSLRWQSRKVAVFQVKSGWKAERPDPTLASRTQPSSL